MQILRNSGALYAREHYYDDARADYLDAVETLERVEGQYPNVPHYRQEMAEMLHAAGALHRPLESMDPSPEALARLEQAAAIGRQLVEAYPQQLERRLALARYESTLGGALHLRGRSDEGTRSYNAAIELLKEASLQAGDNVDTLYTLGELQYTIAEQINDTGRTVEALAMLDEAERSLRNLEALAPRYGEAYLSLGKVLIARSNCLDDVDRLVDAVAELDRLRAVSAKTLELTESPWMQAGMQGVVGLARTIRWGHLKQIRDGAIAEVAERGEYKLAADQARRLPEVTGAACDHYVAALALSQAAAAAAADEKLSEAERRETAEPLAADAVNQLTAAWQQGCLRRSGGWGGWLRRGRTLKDVKSSEEFANLRERADFTELVRRIETEKPP